MRTKPFARLGFVLISIATLIAVLSCSSTDVFEREDAMMADPESDKFLILPINISMPGDEMAQGAALFGGIVKAFGGSGVSLQPLQPVLEAAGLGNYAYSMAWGMHHMVTWHEVFDFKEDAGFHGGASEYAVVLEGIGKLVGRDIRESSRDLGFGQRQVTGNITQLRSRSQWVSWPISLYCSQGRPNSKSRAFVTSRPVRELALEFTNILTYI